MAILDQDGCRQPAQRDPATVTEGRQHVTISHHLRCATRLWRAMHGTQHAL